jgi:hypothetical protein
MGFESRTSLTLPPMWFAIADCQTGAGPKTAHRMCAMMLSPNSEHLISVAPSIKRAKS